jgi:hypothetical protein
MWDESFTWYESAIERNEKGSHPPGDCLKQKVLEYFYLVMMPTFLKKVRLLRWCINLNTSE